MRKLHLKLYLAIVGALAAFLVATAMLWHALVAPHGVAWGIEGATRYAAQLLNEESVEPSRDRYVVESLAKQLRADVALVNGKEIVAVAIKYDYKFDIEAAVEPGWHMHEGPVFTVQLSDGRLLVVHTRRRMLLLSIHVVLALGLIAAGLAMLSYPVARGITKRLERLKVGVQKFGSGDLTVRVPIEGRDEVAALATSFNESAARIEQLLKANQMLLANCSHELRTPLTRMRLVIEKLSDDGAASKELKRDIAELDAIIGELLLSTRLDASNKLEREEIIDLLALAAEEAAYFDKEVLGDAVQIQGDRLLLRRLLRNLLENARAHAGGATEVRVIRLEGTAQLIVEDAGPGIDLEDRDHIFEPFYRSRKSIHAGTGLGLSIVKQIARAHGGDVSCSPREGGGSRFVVTIPMA